MTDRPSHPERMAKKEGVELLRERRRAEVAELLATGITQKTIAERLGISAATVRADLNHARDEWTTRQADAISGEMMAQDLQTARMLEVWMPMALTGDHEAQKRAEAILAYRGKLLGLDKAQPDLHIHAHVPVEASREAQERLSGLLARLDGDTRTEAIELLAARIDPDTVIEGEAVETDA